MESPIVQIILLILVSRFGAILLVFAETVEEIKLGIRSQQKSITALFGLVTLTLAFGD